MFSGGPSVRSSVRPSFRAFFCYQTCEHDISKMNEPILIPIGTSSPRSKDTKRSSFGVKRLKVKITRGQNRFGGLVAEGVILDPLESNRF